MCVRIDKCFLYFKNNLWASYSFTFFERTGSETLMGMYLPPVLLSLTMNGDNLVFTQRIVVDLLYSDILINICVQYYK